MGGPRQDRDAFQQHGRACLRRKAAIRAFMRKRSVRRGGLSLCGDHSAVRFTDDDRQLESIRSVRSNLGGSQCAGRGMARL